MKNLSIEEKAKAYDNIIKKANKMHHENCEACQMCIEELIPELAESEDEKIRKELIYFFNSKHATEDFRGIPFEKVVAWLEKQGEQKPTDKIEPKFDDVEEVNFFDDFRKTDSEVEPKFHEGDWIIFNGLILHIDEIVDGYYRTTSIDGIPNSYDWNIDNVARLWTIQDAKDGDVLANNGNIILFKQISYSARPDYKFIQSYCFVLTHSFDFYLNGTYNLDDGFHPATKEQYDTLMKAMADAGYTFDFEKKELKKIESTNIPKNFEKYVEHLLSLSDGEGHGSPAKVKEVSAELFKLAKLEQNPAWSEKDERMFLDIESLIHSYRVGSYEHELSSWFKSLKPQNKLKLDSSMLICLEYAIKHINKDGDKKILSKLLEQLKKLREG